MRIEEVKIYKFEELVKDVQEKVIEKWYEKEDYPFLYGELKEQLKCNEENIFENDFDLIYSLSYCQGDGLSIEGVINFEKALKLLFPKMKKKEKQFYLDNINVYSSGNNGPYCYCSKYDIKTGDFYYRGELSEKLFDKKIAYFEDEILPAIQKHYLKLCKNLEKTGYSIIEYRMDVEEFTDFCEFNKYEFYENSKMYF